MTFSERNASRTAWHYDILAGCCAHIHEDRDDVNQRFSLEEPMNDAMDSEGNVRYSLDTPAERMALYL